MAYSVKFSRTARERLDENTRYLTEELHLTSSVVSMYDDLESKLNVLRQFPRAYAIDEEVCEATGHTVRSARVRSFRLLYHVDDEKGVVLVFSVRFCSEDPATIRDLRRER